MKKAVHKAIPPTVSIRLSGTGGQGLVLMGHLLAEALGIHGNLNVVLTKAYGPEARGGASRTDIIVGPGEINDLGASHVDILVCLSQQACDKFYPNLVPRGLFIVDSTNVPVVPTTRAIEHPLTQTAIESAKNKMVTNVIALGLLASLTRFAPKSAFSQALEDGIKERFLELNQKAFDIGWQMGRKSLEAMPATQRDQLESYRQLLLPEEAVKPKAPKKPKAPAKTE